MKLVAAVGASLVLAAAAPAQIGDPRDLRGNGTALCGRHAASFFVELGGRGSDVGVSVYTAGAPINRGGQIMYAWASFGSTRIDYSCRRRAASPSTTTGLRKTVTVKNGEFYFERFECNVRGRLVVTIRRLANRVGYVSVRLEGRRPLLLAGRVTRTGGTLRLARECVSNPV